jgi:peptide/nickel transport system permease protein
MASLSLPNSPTLALPPVPAWRRSLQRVLGHRGLTLGSILLGLVVIAALFAPWLSPHDPYAQDVSQRLIPPFWNAKGSWEHVLGTDKLGRDYLSRLLFGARVSLTIGAVTALVGGSLQVVIVLLGLLLWDRFAIVTRSATQQLRDAEFIAAAKSLGASTPYILLRELLPNLMGPLTVVATLEMAHAILLESTLSFLGLGVQPPTPSWGLMVAEGKAYMFFQPWVILVPGVVLALLVLAINLVGDGLRDLTAPDGRN